MLGHPSAATRSWPAIKASASMNRCRGLFDVDRVSARRLEFLGRLLRRPRFLFLRGLGGRFRLRRGRLPPRLLHRRRLRELRLRFCRRELGRRLGGLRFFLLVLFEEPDRLELGQLPEVGDDAELRDEPLLVRLADVRQLDLRGAVLQVDLELVAESVVYVDDGPHPFLGRLRLAHHPEDVLQRLARERIVEVDADPARADGRDDPMLPADGDLHPDFRVDLLPQELPFRPKLNEPWIPRPGAFLRRDQDLLLFAEFRFEEGLLEAFEEPTAADDDGDLHVDFLLVELALLLRDLVMGRVEEGLGPVRVDRPGVVLEPDDVPLLDRLGNQPLTAGLVRKGRTRLNLAGAPCWRAPHLFIPIATEIRLYRFRIVTSVTPATSATSFCVHGLFERIAAM